MECQQTGTRTCEDSDEKIILGHIQGKHGLITIKAPNKEPSPNDLHEIYAAVATAMIHTIKTQKAPDE
ncbi:hypothetical protein C1I60_14235 [Paenibacillus terrae]|uniref:Uncharacterized protein n=1 Tax=Paenibacillus terrae TaxID=159743 RepID=A0A4U2Q286_9BACL|nr:hypothetical protein C1I60_14235 [Paenibacillus terrae]